MKRVLKTALMTMVFALLLCASALAAESGIYGLMVKNNNFTVVPYDANGEAESTPTTLEGIGDVDLYEGAVKVKVTYESPESGKQYLVFALNNDDDIPKENNIAYIDQNGEAEFTVYPGSLDSSKTYSIYVTSNSTGLTKTLVATFNYYQDGLPGDVDLSKNVDMYDVVDLMRHVLKAETISNSTALKNGEVTGDTTLDMNDVVKIMQYVLKAIDSLN